MEREWKDRWIRGGRADCDSVDYMELEKGTRRWNWTPVCESTLVKDKFSPNYERRPGSFRYLPERLDTMTGLSISGSEDQPC